MDVRHGRVYPMLDRLHHGSSLQRVDPVGKVDLIIHVPEEIVRPDPPALVLGPVEHEVSVGGVEAAPVKLPGPPLHRVLGHQVVEVVPGEGAVGVVVAVVPAAGYFVGLQGGTYK